MRIAVLNLARRRQCARLLEQIYNRRIRLPYRFADQFFRERALRALRMIETPRAVDRAVSRQAVRTADVEVLFAVARRGVYGSRALLECHVFAENA